MSDPLTPEAVTWVRATLDMADEALHPDEARATERMSPQRRREYTLGRACARRALARIGVEHVAIVNGEDRAPRWPDGVVGSITHCTGLCAAAVARTGTIASVGIDAEPARPLRPRVIERISSAGERAHLDSLHEPPADASWDVVLFSAKESLYKAYYPLTRHFLGFRDVEIVFAPATRDAGRFEGRLLREDAPSAAGARTFPGRYRVERAHVLTAVTLSAD